MQINYRTFTCTDIFSSGSRKRVWGYTIKYLWRSPTVIGSMDMVCLLGLFICIIVVITVVSIASGSNRFPSRRGLFPKKTHFPSFEFLVLHAVVIFFSKNPVFPVLPTVQVSAFREISFVSSSAILCAVLPISVEKKFKNTPFIQFVTTPSKAINCLYIYFSVCM